MPVTSPLAPSEFRPIIHDPGLSFLNQGSLKTALPMPAFPTHLARHPLRFAAVSGIVMLFVTVPLRAAPIQSGNIDAVLGPSFFLNDVTGGGADADIHQPNPQAYQRSFGNLLTPNQGLTRVILTGLGFAAHPNAAANDATSVAITFTYLGADQALNGGDDVDLGTVTGTYQFTVGGEYVFTFDTPLMADLTITGTQFRIRLAPSNTLGSGSLKLKTGSSTVFEPQLSVAGITAPVITPQRVNLAKFQTVTPGSVAGNRLASFATDGVTGNDNRWQSESWAYNFARIDFPFPVQIGSAQVFSGVDDTLPLGQFAIQYLNGTTWVSIAGADIMGNTNVERNLVFTNPITATSFRLIALDAPIRLREFALYPPNGPAGYPLGTDLNVNLAYQRPAVASSFSTGCYPLLAVDGRTRNGPAWQTTTTGANTLDIEMVTPTKIGSAHLYSGSANTSPLADFTLKYWNGSAWLAIPGGAVTGNASADRVITFTTPVSTTQVRLEFTKSTTSPTVIRELQIFPANTNNVGYALGTNINPSGAYADYEDFNDAFYRINHSASNRDVAVASGGQPALDQTGVTSEQTQYQVLLNLSNGTYRLRNRATGNCLSGSQLSKTAGATLTDAPYLGLPHQDWILEALGGGAYQLINVWSGLALDTQGGATLQGTALVQNTASTATTQRWRFVKETWAPKKGVGGANFAAPLKADWMYNWGPSHSVALPADTIYHPMQWGSFNWTYNSSPGPIWQNNPAWRKRGDGLILMGFNEPDRTDQSNIPLADCVNLWPKMLALDQPLVSPSPGTLNPPAGVTSWHETFYAEMARLGYRVEYNAIHTYPGPSGGSSNNLINTVQTEFNDFGRPVWLTEFSFVDWGRNQSWSEEDNYQCLAEFLWRAENLDALRKYALFIFTADSNNPQPATPYSNYTPAPRSNSYDISGNLTPFGELYAGWDNDITVRPDKTYFIHHKLTRKRIANVSGALGGRTIRVDGTPVNWTLVNATTAGTYYVVSSNDGRRLSSVAGAPPSLVSAGTIGANVEWSLTPTQHGWHHLVHAASSRRLQLAFDNSTSDATYTMASNTTTGDGVEWRFIVPLPENAAPVLAVIPAQAVNELTSLSFAASATDTSLPAGPLTYSLINPPSNASINASTGVFTWTPSESQGDGTTYSVTIRASDGQLSTDRVVSITVNEVNLAPVLGTIPAQTVVEGSILNFTASATDSDIPANTLTYNLVNPPVGATISGNMGVFTWTPSEIQGPGSYTITVRVSDGTTTHDRTVTVNVNESNVAPVLSTIPAQAVNENVLLTFSAIATDADLPSNTITYSLVGGPFGAAIAGSTGAFTWIPNESQGPGSYSFTVRASDGLLTHDRVVTVTVNETNVAPSLAPIPAKTVDEITLLTFTAAATDLDLPANTLTYSLVGAPIGAAINPGSGIFTWTPTETQGPGNFNFVVRVSDGNLFHDQPVSVTVNEINVAPALAAIPHQSVNEGTLLTFTASATDIDLPVNTLTYSLVGQPVGASINANTGAFSWTPTEAQGPGEFSFTVRVHDGNQGNDQLASVTVTSTLPSSQVDTDGDGLSDLLEFAFGTNPATPNGNPFRVIQTNPGTMTLEFTWNWQATGLSWRIRHGNDFSSIPSWSIVAPSAITTTREGNVDRISVSPAMTFPDRGFYVLEVMGN